MECVYTLVSFGAAWLIVQLWKAIEGIIHRDIGKKATFGELVGYFFRSGGMPSGHTASLTAATVYLGCASGFGSGLFALAICTWMIVVYDAIHVRYAVGEQGKALNKLLAEKRMSELPLVEGHTLPQVVVGAVIGVLIGVGMAILTGIL